MRGPRRTVHQGTATSPRQPAAAAANTTVNDVVLGLQRKLTANHLEPVLHVNQRRPSFSMDSLLHKKDKRRDDSKDRHSREPKRISLTMRHSSKSKDRTAQLSPRITAHQPGRFDMIIESPPLVLYGNVSASTGALLSGRLEFLVEDPTGEVCLNTFTMVLKARISSKKPVGKECKDCSDKVDELKTWTFLSEPKTFYKGKDNQFPYSFLFPGHLPATTNAPLGSIQYSLHATAVTSTGEKIVYHYPLTIQRAIQPGPDKSSIRIFPPTNLTGRVQLPPIVHPIGTFPVSMSLSGVVEKKGDSQTRWRLRKLSWRVEEHSKVISTPCAKHAHKVSEGKSILHNETRILGTDEMKTGWKSDFDTIGGEINVEFEASLANNSKFKAVCDVESPAGIEVKHNLVIELIVAEEFCPSKNSQLITPTGAARVLRMQFALVVTERAGMGISWDEEMPPVYEDVPESPPGYGSADKNDGAWGGAIIEDYNGPALEYEDLETMGADSSISRPSSSGLPTRPRLAGLRTGSGEGGPSTPRHYVGFTNDELSTEPPQYALRSTEDLSDAHSGPVEDTAQGVSSSTVQH